MTDKISRQEVENIAKLARLKCSDQELQQFTGQLGAILDYVQQLEQVDTEGVEPMAHCLPVTNVLREDEVRPGLTNDQALQNAPHRDGEFFAVPKVLGDGA